MSVDSAAPTPPRIAALIVAAGRGERAGAPGDVPKQYRMLGGLPVLTHALGAFAADPRITDILTVIHPQDQAHFDAAAQKVPPGARSAVPGGDTRQQSVLAGLEALTETEPHYVLIHDAARPLVDAALLDRIIAALEPGAGVLPALPVADTLKAAGAEGLVERTVSRAGLHGAQTPQAFAFTAILQAHRAASRDDALALTDDAAVAERSGMPVRIVPGAPRNVKLTWPEDFAMAEKMLGGQPGFADVRVGNGYDVHAFGPGDKVTLCGVTIPHDRALKGHSDADVGLHALTDALLATLGAGDIGDHFPPSDPQWKDAPSRIFADHAATLVRQRGGRIANADVTLIAETPKIAPHRDAMRARLADILDIDVTRCSVKATTNEKIGFVGRGEGIAAIATAAVVFAGETPP